MSLSFIFWTTCTIGLVSFWWRSDRIKRMAMNLVLQYCQQQNLQLLDQTMVLKGVWPQRGSNSSLLLRRRYAFEFTSTGEERYAGMIELYGQRIQRIELAPHILPEEKNHLH